MTSRGPLLPRLARAVLQPRPTSFGHPTTLARRFFTSYDGTRIAYYQTGKADGPPFVISAGLGGGVRAWSAVIEELAKTFRIYAWDYRGLYASSPAPDPTRYAIEDHAADLHALLEHLDLDDPILAGWSMGVQVTLELHRHHHDRPRAVVAVHGAPGSPLTTAFDSTVVERISPGVFDAMRRYWRMLDRPIWQLARSRRVSAGFMTFCQSLGIMDETMDPELFHEMARDWVQLDIPIYADIFERLGEHDATDLLPRVVAPMLVIGGGNDRFTPLRLSELIADGAPHAELFVVPEATHFGLLEYPNLIVDRILRFADERLGIGSTTAG